MKIKTISFILLAWSALQLMPTQIMAAARQDSTYKCHVSTTHFLVAELASGSMGGFFGLLLSSCALLRLTDSRLNLVDNGDMNIGHSLFFAVAITGYATGAAFGCYIVTKRSVPDASFGRQFMLGIGSVVVGTALIHTPFCHRTPPLITDFAVFIGTGLLIYGPIIAPAVNGLIQKFDYEKISLAYQPLLLEKRFVHGLQVGICF
jgi:hypothetical protein